ncbi:LysE family translocator [Halobacterium sp. KA-6]|uniref:LysE family translocator n=1 Tax=Halobacterium sp. KA-6 TaxID=2896368 RepID=UPI001E362208|nr:LysE family translocator [Halobacterium sp. KA-6]MCD2202326.1 LysE family translocator [Halobacterium sp. KA-6]
MFDVAVSVIAGLALGLSLAAPPGPMNAVIAEEAVTRGWRAGFFAGLGAMAADACFFVLALVGVVALIHDAPAVETVMVGIGGVLMLYYAYGAFQDAGSFSDAEPAEGRGFRKAFVLALANPYQMTWWLTAGVALLNPTEISAFGLQLAAGNGALTIAGFFSGILLWAAGFPASLRAAGERVDAFGKAVAYVSAGALAVFGVLFLKTAAGL